MASNSDGFIDRDFGKKPSGECWIGLLGGSGAMSWGVRRNSDRISSNLESILNKDSSRRKKCSSFRILNLGIGSHHVVQTQQIFSWFSSRLDAAIVYVGNNECSHPSTLAKPNSVLRFPEFDLASITGSNLYLSKKILQKKQEIDNVKRWKTEHEILYKSRTIKFLTHVIERRYVAEYYDLNTLLQNWAEDTFISKLIDHSVPETGPFLAEDYLWRNVNLQESILKKVWKPFFTVPIENMLAISEYRDIPILIVLQPLRAIWPQQNNISPYPLYQKTCYESRLRNLKKYAPSLSDDVVDLNSNIHSFWDRPTSDFFIEGDNVHLTPQGNKAVARTLANTIIQSWRL